MSQEPSADEASREIFASSPHYGLDLLDFQLPEFSRMSWTGDAAREVWEPRLRQIFKAWMEIEPLAVVDGIRRCSLTMVGAEQLPRMAMRYAGHGFNALPLSIQTLSGYSYSNQETAPTAGQPFLYRVVLGTPADVSSFKAAWDACDQEAIGSLLGYPDCCREFFHDVWVEHGLRDTTWPMAVRSLSDLGGCTIDGRTAQVHGPPECNILWRWMGVRAVSHLPCSFGCRASLDVGRRLLELGRGAGYEQEVDWILEILSWPTEWSCLHGIAEIKTPLLKVSAATDATASRFVVQRPGENYPEEGARGLTWAYRKPATPLLTGSKRFAAGIANPIGREKTKQR